MSWRDQLDLIIKKKFKSRYAFCKEVGLDQGFLSNVLKKKKGLSIENLSEILDKIGYKITIVPTKR